MTPNRAVLNHSNRIFLIPQILLLILLVQVLYTSCNSDSTIIGETLQPPSERMRAYHLDTCEINAFTFSQDSILSSNSSRATVGRIADTRFGSTMASFLFRVRLYNYNGNTIYFAPGPDAVADSVVLTLLPDRFYGDSLTKMNLKVYRLNEDILLDSVYYSNKVPNYNPATGHAKTISVTDTLIRFVLDPTFFRETLADIDTIDSNAELREYFKGVYVAADPVPVEGEGAIMLFDLVSIASQMTIYYRTPTDTLSYPFEINEASARINMFSHDHSLGIIDTTGTEDTTLIFVQGLGGTYVRIDFPHLDDLKDLGDVAINKAEIKFKIFPTQDSALYPPPESLILLTTNDEGNYISLFDSQLGVDYYGGTLDEEEGLYVFTITNHVKDYLSGDTPYSSIYLFVGNQGISPERVILHNNDPPDNIQFRIIYTLL